jgi:CRISPR-associated endoribonuclease Cas6
VLNILEECARGLLSGRLFRLGNNELLCSGVEVASPVVVGTRVLLRTLSPITVYSTLRKGDGRPYAVYYEPQETAFSEQIASNLRKKQAALAGAAGKNCPGERDNPEVSQGPLLRFRPVGRVRRVTGFFSPGDTFPVKGWDGLFRLEGPRELLQLALDAGLGAKNSSGWGCVELVREAGDAEEATGAVSAVPCG